MPKNSSIPFIMSALWFFAGFGFVFDWMWLTIPALIGVAISMIARSFSYDTDYYIPADEVKRTEAALKGAKV
jgi:cytochrome aa3-600 menaquinol oxidase subunit 1